MALGLFDPPQMKAQRRAAATAGKLREQAARDAGIQVQMLARRYGDGVRLANSPRNIPVDAVTSLRLALYDAEALIGRVNSYADACDMDLAAARSMAKDASGYEQLATLEITARNGLLALRDEARMHLADLGRACLAVSQG